MKSNGTPKPNYALNLLHSRFGVDSFNIFEGPANGFEMLYLFEKSLQAVDHVGNPVLANGDVIVISTAAFTTEPVFVENQLRLMLRNHGVELLFQPPYSPEFNSCEFCFRSMWAYSRQHEQFSINFTEPAIIQGLQTITPAISQNIFSHCGFTFCPKRREFHTMESYYCDDISLVNTSQSALR